jgi:uncharacterized membrane protein
MSKVEWSIDIGAPIKEVFEYVATHSNTTKYIANLKEFEPTSSKEYGVGSRFRWEVTIKGLRVRSEFVVTEFVPHERMTAKTISGFRGASRWSFRPVENGTRATLSTYYEAPGALLGALVGRIMLHEELEEQLKRSLLNLKRNLERIAWPQSQIGQGKAVA